ncbi:Protein vreteno [Formica fusca]
MAYFDADMDAEPIFDRMDTEYTIYVKNLPSELDEVAIKEVFNQYGKIIGMLYPHNAKWACITYKSYREAEQAIRELNNKKPLYLKVALAKERSVIREDKLPKSYVSEASGGRPRAIDTVVELPVSTRNDMRHQNGVGRGQTLNVLRKHFVPQMTLSDRYAENVPLFSQASNLYEIEEPTVNTNRLWTRGVITVTEDGRRHVSLGRGYTLYEFPEQNPKVEECIVHVLEKRHNGLYEYGEDKLKNGVQRCLICSNKTNKHCEKCNTYYCSKVCQESDWPRHQVECQRIPRLVEEPINDMSLLQISKDENQTKIPSMSNKTITSKTIASNEIKLRRPNASNAMQAENPNSTNANINMHKNNVDITNCSTNSDINSQDKHMSIHDNNTNISHTETIDQQTLSTMNTKDFSKQNQLHRYNNIKDNTEKSRRNDGYSSTTSNFTNQNHSHNHQNGAIKKTNPHKEKFDNSSLRSRSQSYQKNELQNDRKSTAYNDREIVDRQGSSSSNSIAMDDDLAFYKNMYLSKTEFTEVEILIPLDNGEYWISTLKDLETCTKLMTELQSVAKKSRNVQPIIGNIYGVLYETLWHRAMIISLNPVKVHFIDYGNDEILQKDAEIRDISDMIKVPNLARKIRLTSATNEKYRDFQYGERIFVKMLSIDAEKTIIVDVKEQSRKLSLHMENASNMNTTMEKSIRQENLKVSNENIKASMAQTPPTILDGYADLFSKKAIPELEFVGFIQIHESVQENVYNATLGPQDFTAEIEALFNELQEECVKTQESVHYIPRVEDLICGEGKDGWCRGYILPSSTSSDLHIIAIDEAKYMSVNKILPCPKRFLNIHATGVICEVSHPNKLTAGEIYQFTTIMNEQNHKQENLKIKIFKESEFVCEAMMKSWKFMTKSSFPAFSEIKSGSKICFTSYRNHYQVFARSLDEEAIEYYNNIMQHVAQCARTAPRLSDPPYNKQAVIAPFSDNNSYRALVINTQNDKAKIVYTDFGNVDDVDIRDLQVLPETLALQRSCSAKISLKNVPSEVSMNTEVDLFLRELVGNETSLICAYEGDPLKDGVHLTMPTGESVNDKINQLLTPTWKQTDHCDNTCYMINDVEFASLGQVGDILNALVLHIPKEDGGTRYMIGPCDIELYTHVTEVMPKLLREYCEKTEYYIPRENELCLALYQNEWYRAECLNPKKSYTTAVVFYIDYGNIETVEHKNIRLMPKDFITPAVMANVCTVVNLAPVDNAGNYSPIIREKIAELIQNNGSIVKIKIVEIMEQGIYKIELVEVKNTLIEEGLISSS